MFIFYVYFGVYFLFNRIMEGYLDSESNVVKKREIVWGDIELCI